MGTYYRVWQFWQAVTARPLDEKAEEEIRTVLSPQQQRLFGRFSASEQQHSYRIYKAICQVDNSWPDLLAAALLHDIGKTRYPRIWWYKPLVVLGKALLPRQSAGWSKQKDSPFTRPFIIKEKHPEWGAAEAETADSSPQTVLLIRHHHDPITPEMDQLLAHQLKLLQWADDNN